MNIEAISNSFNHALNFFSAKENKAAKVALGALGLLSATLLNVYYPKARLFTAVFSGLVITYSFFNHYLKAAPKREIHISRPLNGNVPNVNQENKPIVPTPVEPRLRALPAPLTPFISDEPEPPNPSRTTIMVDRLKPVWVFNAKKMMLNIYGVPHCVVNSETTDFANGIPLVSCGTGAREIIVLDPRENRVIEMCYLGFVAQFKFSENKLSEKEVFGKLVTYMQIIFLRENSKKLDDLIDSETRTAQLKIGKEACISITTFINKRCGVCRHHSLFAAYIVDRFLKEHAGNCSFNGKVQVIRDTLSRGGAHAWLSFSSTSGKLFLVDTLNKYLGDLADPQFVTVMNSAFGKQAIAKHRKKAKAV